jgi:glycosyltransferase involved in cell wall biosynthesis
MSRDNQPLVSVLTPVYNGEEFIQRCIESVLAQTMADYEYIIVNNCSTDRTLEIAQNFARKDSRIRVHDNGSFLGVIANHNLAFSTISPASRYCKVVSADDWVSRDCLEQMVAVAEANPSVGLVGTYLLAGKKVMNSGLEYNETVVNGRDICRATLLGGPHVFGSPTSLLYRADLVRRKKDFYPHPNPHSDTTACYQALHDSDFGFVHQILSYAQIHTESQTSKSFKYGTIRRMAIADVVRVGPLYLTPGEIADRVDHLMRYYYQWLVGALIANRGDPEFWPRQKAELEEVEVHLSLAKLCAAGVHQSIRSVLDPLWAIDKITKVLLKDPRKVEAQYY